MASNFWQSSHWRYLVPIERLVEAHAKDRDAGLTNDSIQRIKIHVLSYLSDVAKISQQLIRQRVVGTAMTYFRRVYLFHDFSEYDPRLMGPACLFLACKAEEAQVQAKTLFQIMKKLEVRWPTWPILEMQQLLDLEMALLEILDFSLLVYSPYRDLVHYLEDPRVTNLAEFAWAILNDSFRTDLCLLYPPFCVAIAAINLAAIAAEQNIEEWLQSHELEYSLLADVTKELIFSYRHYQEAISLAEFDRCMKLVKP